MKKYKIKKLIYTFVSLCLVIVLSVPNIVKAENIITFTTWECVKDVYTEGSWKDMTLECVYNCSNNRYEKYKNYLETVPETADSYDYYVYYINGGDLIFLGFDTGSYGYLFHSFNLGGSELINPNAALVNLQDLYSSCKKAIDSSTGYYAYSSIICEVIGTYDKYTLNTLSSNPVWTKKVSGNELNEADNKHDTVLINGAIINTNMDLYSLYEYNQAYYINEESVVGDEPFHQHKTPTEQDFLTTSNEFQQLTILNSNLKHYDGENIVGGAPTFDLSLGFDDFDMYKINHPDFVAGTGCRLDWSLTPDTLKSIDVNWDIQLDFTITYSMYEIKENNYLADKTSFDRGVIYDTQIMKLDDYVTQDGSYLYDFVDVVNSESSAGFLFEALRNSHYENVGSDIIMNIDDKIMGSVLKGLDVSQVCPFISEYYYGFEYLQVSVVGRLVNEKDNIKSNSFNGYVDILTGSRSGFVNEVNDDDVEVVNPDSQYDDDNFYDVVVETDSEGNTYYNYYYYDTTNNTVTPSIGGQSTLNLIHTFANSLNVTGVSSSGGSSSSSSGGSGDVVDVTIEDDDYTDTALRDDIADGFGLLDNNGTEELDDGFLSVAAAFFESIDPDAAQILMFGISSVVAIGILRAIFRR